MHVESASAAFVLRARSYGESDRIVTFITEHHGKLTGIAKGAKNSRRRFGGTLEPFVRVRVVFRQRPASDLAFLMRCELLGALHGFRRDLDRFATGTYLLELVDRLVFGRECGREVYRLIDDALTLLDGGAAADPLLRAFELHLLAATGYAPGLDRCCSCGRDLGSTSAYLLLTRGGFVCRACVPPGEAVRPVAPTTVEALARLASNPLDAAGTGIAPSTLVQAATIAEQLVGAVTTGPLRARTFLAQARVDSPGIVR